MKKKQNKDISYMIDLSREEGFVVFGYFFDEYNELIERKASFIADNRDYCKRNDKKMDCTSLVTAEGGFELKIKIYK